MFVVIVFYEWKIYNYPMFKYFYAHYKNIPFTLKFEVFDPFFFDICSFVKACGVRQIDQQAHLHLDTKQEAWFFTAV